MNPTKEVYDEVRSESGSPGTFGTILGRFLRVLVIHLVVTLYDDE